MSDPFKSFSDSPAGPSSNPYPIVPHATNPLSVVPKGIYVGSGGDVTLRGVGSDVDVTYRNLPNASFLAVRAAFVRSTGTTATALIAEA